VNLLLVNPVHPETAHISAVRASRFADELAQRGHRVVLLCAGAPTPVPADVAGHDWRRPMVVPVPADAAIAGALPGPLGRLDTAVRLLLHGGRQGRWVANATAAAEALAPRFRPDVLWATFGRLESIVAGRRIARRLGIPWVLDLKDKWELFVPSGMRRLVARRTRGWSAMTANSAVNIEQAARWHGGRAELIYSGIDDAVLPGPGSGPDRARFVVNLVGSLYFPDQVDGFLVGLRLWCEQLPAAARAKVALHYLGGDAEMMRTCFEGAGLDIELVAAGYLRPQALAEACGRAAVNAYVAYPGSFHHKLLELLACNRPVVAYPGESPEAHALAAGIGGALFSPTDPADLAALLGRLHEGWLAGQPAPAVVGADRYSWRAQAALLEETLSRVAES
jgi:glycosyltransferase involved in cell wall biosynthesis